MNVIDIDIYKRMNNIYPYSLNIKYQESYKKVSFIVRYFQTYDEALREKTKILNKEKIALELFKNKYKMNY